MEKNCQLSAFDSRGNEVISWVRPFFGDSITTIERLKRDAELHALDHGLQIKELYTRIF